VAQGDVAVADKEMDARIGTTWIDAVYNESEALGDKF
jgi:hypothetical protein